LSDDSKKSPEDGDSDLPELSEEDIFLKTKVSSSSQGQDEDQGENESSAETANHLPSETVEEFESLDDSQSEKSLQFELPESVQEADQSAPGFSSITELGSELGGEIDELSSQPVEHQAYTPELSGSLSHAAANTVGTTTTKIEATSKTIDSIKNYSESLNAEGATAPAQLPFTLRIEGKLSPQEAEKLLDVLSREKMDIREVDLEPQLEAGRVLIPRISEYAGVLLIQAKIYFQPSDIDPSASDSVAPADFNDSFNTVDAAPSAESLPVTQGDDLPQLGVFQVIDTLLVSGMLTTRSVEALNSNEFTILTESLMRELKFKAARRGARGITHLSIQLTPLTLPTDYRVTVSGTAVS
jgi:hypothetical protein